MKKVVRLLALILVIILSISLVACNVSPEIIEGAPGKDGADGKDGVVPHIGENGNWFIGDQDTGISAKGADGAAGKDGADGKDGANGKNGVDGINGTNGKSAYDVAVENGFMGTYEEWRQLIQPDQETLVEAILSSGSADLEYLASYLLKASGFVNIADYVEPNSGKDVWKTIQKVIDENPNKTIYFPDGEYLVTKPIKTSAKFNKSVSLYLSNYAIIKADPENWTGTTTITDPSSVDSEVYRHYKDAEDYVIMLGASEHWNTIYEPGSNYFLEGGIIDGSGVANGISIDSGRETRVENVAIKNCVTGFCIKSGANNKSSDSDILNLSIAGTGESNSVGIRVIGYDNTFDGMRVSNVKTGIEIVGGGNFFRDIFCEYTLSKDLYSNSIGVDEQNGGNWFDLCNIEQFESAYKIVGGSNSVFNCCSASWNDGTYGQEIAFKAANDFKAAIRNPKITFCETEGKASNPATNYVLRGVTKVPTDTTSVGYFQYPVIIGATTGVDDQSYTKFVVEYVTPTTGGNAQ